MEEGSKKHGPYWRWSGLINKKRKTIHLSSSQAKECKIRIQRYQKMKKALEKILTEDLKNPPWKSVVNASNKK